MQRYLVVLSLVVLTGCLLGTTAVAAQGDVTVTVTVVDQNGESVGSGVTVNATWDGGETSARTAANGQVFLDVPEGADVELDIDDDRYVRNQPRLVSNASQRDVELRVSPQGVAAVSVNDTDGEPLPDATVRLWRDGEVASVGDTGDDGVFRSDAVEQGQYRLQVVKPGYYRTSEQVTVNATTETGVTLEAGRVSLDITVFDDHFEEPRRLADTRLLVEGSGFDANVTAGDGSASLSVPVNTRYRIVAIEPGYEGDQQTVSVGESAQAVNVTAQRIPELVVTVSNRRVIVGETTRVGVTNAYGEPVPNATVQLNGSAAGTTDDRGEVTVSIDEPGNRTIVASDGEIDSDPVVVAGVDPDAETETETATTTASPTAEPTETSTPGFGVVITVAALLVAFGAIHRTRT